MDAERTIQPTLLDNALSLPQSHPKGLYLLFFTELWERFGFYTVQAIIILYMTKPLGMSDNSANLLYAAFSALLYLTPTIGGYLADQYIGFQRAIIIGGFLFIASYLTCAWGNETLFFVGLSLLICANGFFKPTVSAIVGELYKKNDPRRDGGFTIFYMGINIGALIPPLIASALIVHYGWHAGFYVAALGMGIGQLIFHVWRNQLGAAGILKSKPLSVKFYLLLAAGIAATVAICQTAFLYPKTTNILIELSAILIVLWVLYLACKQSTHSRNRMLAALILIAISVAFWSLYNQSFTSLTLFADRNMEKKFLGFDFDATASQFFNPFFILALSPILSRLWLRMDDNGINLSTQMKFFLGVVFVSAGFFLLAFGTIYYSKEGMVSPWWLCISYLLQTIAELLISPIGLAMITVLSPKHLVGLMMGVWFFAQAASFSTAGFLANIAAIPAEYSPIEALPIYTQAFIINGLISLLVAVISLCLIPILNRMIKEA